MSVTRIRDVRLVIGTLASLGFIQVETAIKYDPIRVIKVRRQGVRIDKCLVHSCPFELPVRSLSE